MLPAARAIFVISMSARRRACARSDRSSRSTNPGQALAATAPAGFGQKGLEVLADNAVENSVFGSAADVGAARTSQSIDAARRH